MPHSEPTKFYLTTPIYYVNARPHIGHAYTTIVADVLARRHRLLGHETFFLTGTDEHGQKIERSAAAAGVPPQQFADQVSQSFRDLWDRMGLTYDRYIRTTSDPHKQGAQALFAELFRLGHIYLSSYTGSYCVSDEAFVDLPPSTPCPDCGRPLETVTEENFFFRLSAFQLPLLDLIESNTLRITPEGSRNEVLSFLRGNLQSIVREYWDDKFFNLPEREMVMVYSLSPDQIEESYAAAEARADLARTRAGTPYLPGALKDLSISRSSFTWGIPVPEPAASLTQQPHVIYVWLDALANYMTAIGYGNPDPLAQAEFRKWWPADLHLVGKEITRFHCIYWPAFLLALNPATAPSATNPPGAPFMAQRDMSGEVATPSAHTWATPQAEWSPEEHGLPPEIPSHSDRVSSRPERSEVEGPAFLPRRIEPIPDLTPADHAIWAKQWLPKQITANGWLLFDNSKMSKSKGNVVRTETILDAFGEHVYARHFPDAPKHDQDLFAADVLRYYLLREIPFGQDGSFTFDALVTRYNADLANGYGNLVSRVLTLVKTQLEAQFSQIAKTPFSFRLGPQLEYSDNENRFVWEYGQSSLDDPLFKGSSDFEGALSTLFQENKLSQACELLSQAVTQVDGYLSEHQPWKLAKTDAAEDRAKLVEVLYTAAESIRILTALLHPILPYATATVWTQLGLGSIEEAATRGDLRNLQWGDLQPGTKLGNLGPIFPRADKSLIETMTNMESQNTPAFSKPALTPITDNNDATHPDQSPFPEAPLASATANTPILPATLTDELVPSIPTPASSTDPAAGPRTLSPADPGTTVAGSHAITTERPGTPSHTEATPSGIFAGGPIPIAPSLTGTPAQTPDPTAPTPADQSPEITIDDFAKIDLRVAEVLVCERIPKADKLLRLEVDLGPELGRRQILSGIAEHYAPETLVGRRIVVITNLAPRKMRGLLSHGMLLAATDPTTGKPILATMAEDTPPGARLK